MRTTAVYLLISPQSAPNGFQLINNPRGTVCFSHETMATLLDKHNPKTQLEILHSGPRAPQLLWDRADLD